MDGVKLISREEYLEEQRKLEEMAEAAEEEVETE